MSDTKSGHITVPGASLYYHVQGAGPVLLLLQGGDGDATGTVGIAAQLATHYTVVTYDRRGLSRSTIQDKALPVDIKVHADDAHRLLAAVSAEPASVFGTSLGALLGLELIASHPEQVRLLVAHEPPASQFLPDPERDAFAKSQLEVEDAFRSDGIGAAMRKFAAIAGLDFNDREPEATFPAPTPQRVPNLTFFLTHDAAAVRLHRLDFQRVKVVSEKILIAIGSTSGARGPARCALALASALGRKTVELPGGHAGFLTHPKAFAAQLEAVLARS